MAEINKMRKGIKNENKKMPVKVEEYGKAKEEKNEAILTKNKTYAAVMLKIHFVYYICMVFVRNQWIGYGDWPHWIFQ